MNDQELDLAARIVGIQTSYLNNHGEMVHSTRDAVRDVLAALGPPEGAALDVVVAWDGLAPTLPSDISVATETGERLDHSAVLPFGYHRLICGDAPVGTLISTPRRAPAPPPGLWGVLLPLYSLRTRSTRGVATYAELDQLFAWLHRFDGSVLLTLPLLPLYLDEPADWSPYSPVSRLMWNELYVDLAGYDPAGYDPAGYDLAGYDGGGGADGSGGRHSPPALHDDVLDYPELHRHQSARLDAVSVDLIDDPDLRRYLRDRPLVAEYARFRGAQHRLGRNFRNWPGTGRVIAAADVDPTVERRHLVGTWLADRQLGAVAQAARQRHQRLGLDLALGTHSDGFDVWHEGDLFVEGMSVGAPPDPFFAGGQDWAFPPIHPERSRATGHRYFRDTLRHHLRHAGVLRLDHVMGLARQWWVPRGRSAADGVYVRYPLDELFAVVCLEAHLAGAFIVGENLGTVPPEVHGALLEHGLLGIHVGQDALPSFGTGHVRRSGTGTMAMLSTHDSVPLAGYWRGGDIVRSHHQGLIADEERNLQLDQRAATRERVVEQLTADGRLATGRTDLRAVMAGISEDLAGQAAEIVVLNLEDLWLEERPQNSPGTFQEVPNWRRVAALTLEQIAADPEIDATLARVADARRQVDGIT